MSSVQWDNTVGVVIDQFKVSLGTDAQVVPLRKLAGKSGAHVYIADIATANGLSGVFIVKIESRDANSSPPMSEADAHAVARSADAKFGADRIPEIVRVFKFDTTEVVLFRVAAGGIEYVQPLAMADAESFPALIQSASYELLTSWNRDASAAQGDLWSPQKILSRWLGYRTEAAAGGRLPLFAEEHGMSMQTPAITFCGAVLPNPLVWCVSGEDVSSVSFRPIMGRLHGDLHCNNILSSPGDKGRFFVIDFALFQSHAPLLYDQAYLEISALLDLQGSLAPGAWFDLAKKIAGIKAPRDLVPSQFSSADLGKIHPLMFIRERVFAWIKNHHKDRASQIENQYRLARIAAALNFVNKRGLPPQLAMNAYLYACVEASNFLQFNSISLPSAGVALQINGQRTVERQGAWREIWAACADFDASRSSYVLCGDFSDDSELAINAESISRLPWTMVIDLARNGSESRSIEIARVAALSRRAFHKNLPTDTPKVSFARSLVWLMTKGNCESPNSVTLTVSDWRRRGYLEGVRAWLRALRAELAPKKVVIVFAISSDDEIQFSGRVWECFDEVFGDQHRVVVLTKADLNPEQLPEELASRVVEAPLSALADGVIYQLGSDSGVGDRIFLPRRQPEDDEQGRLRRAIVPVDDISTVRYIEEEFELVHRGLCAQTGLAGIAEPPFLRGNEISWQELEARIDVNRDVYAELLATVETKLESYSNESLEFHHHPGAGATTVLRRLAWDLKDKFPVVILRSHSAITPERIGALFALCGLPVLLIADGGALTESDRERLYRAIRARNVRCLILHASRSSNPANRERKLTDPMGDAEAKRFFGRYAAGLAPQRANMLGQLASAEQFRRYRSAFFFGLYAFEEQFTHIRDFVAHHLTATTSQSRLAIQYIALVTAYSQVSLSIDMLAAIFDLPTDTADAELILGDQCARLVVAPENGQVRVVHPLIAKEILRHTVGENAKDAESEAWKLRLADISIRLICDLHRIAADQDIRSAQVLEHLLINREPWAEANGTSGSTLRGNFSQLLSEIPDSNAQARVLGALTENFPNEPHYWNHRGRHSNLILKESYHLAEEYLQNAIDLQPHDSLHRHSLGMVYRSEVRRVITVFRKQSGLSVDDSKTMTDTVFDAIHDLHAQAMACFDVSRDLDPDNDHGYITAVQLTVETIRALRDLSGHQNVTQLVGARSRVGRWVREALARGEEIFEAHKDRHAQDAASKFAIKCEGDLRELYGDFSGMISELHKLLSHPDTDASTTRRLIANAYLSRRKHNWANLESKDLRAINQLASENLEKGDPTDQDYSHWFQTYRRLPEYDESEARRRLMIWAQARDSTQAHYYLYVLQFIRWYFGDSNDLTAMERHLKACTVDTGIGGNTRSTEWLGAAGYRCPMVHFGELGNWGDTEEGHRFYSKTECLERVQGIVGEIKKPQAGHVLIYPRKQDGVVPNMRPFRAFFAPGSDFRPGRDEHQTVDFFLGFSAVGLRAWGVRRMAQL